MRRVVIVGGGFGGLTAAQALRRAPVQITLIDRTNHHLFQPLLYQVATAALSPSDIASPLRAVLRRQPNVTVVMDDVHGVDRARRVVALTAGEIPYDILILAPGTRHSYFGHDDWEAHAPGLKTIADALTIRERVLLAFERAASLADPAEAARHLTFVIVGGGATGVEVAGALAEIACRGLLPDFRSIRREDVRIILLEGGDRLLAGFHPSLSARAQRLLEELGVEVRLHAPVTAVTDTGVTARDARIDSATVIWAPGNVAPPWLKTLDAPLGRHGQVRVQSDLSVPGDPWVFVIGDAAECLDEAGRPLPALAPVAMQQGRYVGRLIADDVAPGRRPPFRYADRGTLATIGKARAVAQIGPIRTAGLFAWLLWSVVHIFFLIGFRNRVRVMLEWIWYYLTYRPGARIIYKRQ